MMCVYGSLLVVLFFVGIVLGCGGEGMGVIVCIM